jgi:hypothetical protein
MIERRRTLLVLAFAACFVGGSGVADAQCPPGQIRQDIFAGTNPVGEPRDGSCLALGAEAFQVQTSWEFSGPVLCVANCPGKPDGGTPAAPRYKTFADDFSLRFHGTVPFQEGTYEFLIQSDDGVRLALDGEQLYADWSVHAAPGEPVRVVRRVGAGMRRVVIEYFEQAERSVLRVGWRRVGP